MNEEGLSFLEAAKRLEAEGYNELPAAERHSFLQIIFSVIKEPMFSLLLAAGVVYFLIGDFIEALLLSLFALLSVLITVIQEWRSERVLEALRDLSSPRALVIRDGTPQRIAGREVVRGDIIMLLEGDRVPADAGIISNDSLMVDESLLTGESVPVRKSRADNEDAHVFAGTLIVRGTARGQVIHTGQYTEIGKIGNALYSIKTEPSRIQTETGRIVKIFALISIILSVFSTVLYGLWHHDWVQGILSGIALSMSLLPEEFPLVLTVFMTMGAWRISRARVLTRKMAAIETLGAATVLCTDKTGTLTQNKMSLVLLQSEDSSWKENDKNEISQDISSLLYAGLMASNKDSHDPMDLAFYEHPHDRPVPVADRRYGLRPDLLLTAAAYKAQDGHVIYAKGAPETVAKACKFTAEDMDNLHRKIEIMAADGLRVLAIAQAQFTGNTLPDNAASFDYHFLGLAGFADPLRPDVPLSIEQCRSAGIRVIMMTGDYPATAQAIARQAGLKSDQTLSGTDISSMTDDDLFEKIKTVNIFARISPDQKLRIVTALKKSGEIVAMTGDGVNDAPSLKAAHIGVAMGGRGTDVAREASSIVLLDDNFSSLVNTIAMGRRIYDNLKKAMIYICAIHVPIAGLAFLPLIFKMPLILTPLLIATTEMVIDPACSIVLEAEKAERDVMKRPPRSPSASLLSPQVMAWGFIQGFLALTILGITWYTAYRGGLPIDEIRSLVFASLLVINITLILVNRSFSPSLIHAFQQKNPFLGWGTASVFSFFGILLYWPPAKELFDFGPLHLHDLVYAVFSGVFLLILLETSKLMMQRRILA